MSISKEISTTLLPYHSAISPLLLSKLSDSSILQISVRFDSLGNVDDHLGSDEEEEAPAALSIMLSVKWWSKLS